MTEGTLSPETKIAQEMLARTETTKRLEAKVVQRQQRDGWCVFFKTSRHWFPVTTDANAMYRFTTKQEALDYVQMVHPDAIVMAVEAIVSDHAGRHTKPRVDLIDPTFIVGLGMVLGEGAKKYDAENWRLGSAWSERYGSLQRHLQAWWAGETLDEESGQSHLYHAATNAMILAYWQLCSRGTDDRPK